MLTASDGDRPPQRRHATGPDRVEPEVGDAQHAVGEGERQAAVAEHVGDAQRRRPPWPPSRRTSAAGPGPPRGRSGSSARRSRPTPTTAGRARRGPRATPGPRRVVLDRRRALGDGEDEHEVEEQLQVRDPRARRAARRTAAVGGGARSRADHRAGIRFACLDHRASGSACGRDRRRRRDRAPRLADPGHHVGLDAAGGDGRHHRAASPSRGSATRSRSPTPCWRGCSRRTTSRSPRCSSSAGSSATGWATATPSSAASPCSPRPRWSPPSRRHLGAHRRARAPGDGQRADLPGVAGPAAAAVPAVAPLDGDRRLGRCRRPRRGDRADARRRARRGRRMAGRVLHQPAVRRRRPDRRLAGACHATANARASASTRWRCRSPPSRSAPSCS